MWVKRLFLWRMIFIFTFKLLLQTLLSLSSIWNKRHPIPFLMGQKNLIFCLCCWNTLYEQRNNDWFLYHPLIAGQKFNITDWSLIQSSREVENYNITVIIWAIHFLKRRKRKRKEAPKRSLLKIVNWFDSREVKFWKLWILHVTQNNRSLFCALRKEFLNLISLIFWHFFFWMQIVIWNCSAKNYHTEGLCVKFFVGFNRNHQRVGIWKWMHGRRKRVYPKYLSCLKWTGIWTMIHRLRDTVPIMMMWMTNGS